MNTHLGDRAGEIEIGLNAGPGAVSLSSHAHDVGAMRVQCHVAGGVLFTVDVEANGRPVIGIDQMPPVQGLRRRCVGSRPRHVTGRTPVAHGTPSCVVAIVEGDVRAVRTATVRPGDHGLFAHQIGPVVRPDFDRTRPAAVDTLGRQRTFEIAGSIESHGLAPINIFNDRSPHRDEILKCSMVDPGRRAGTIVQIICPQINQQFLGRSDAGRGLTRDGQNEPNQDQTVQSLEHRLSSF